MANFFPERPKVANRKGYKKNTLFTPGKAFFVNTYCSIVKGRYKPVKSHQLCIQNYYCLGRVVKVQSLASL